MSTYELQVFDKRSKRYAPTGHCGELRPMQHCFLDFPKGAPRRLVLQDKARDLKPATYRRAPGVPGAWHGQG